jgi:hypothetical protein
MKELIRNFPWILILLSLFSKSISDKGGKRLGLLDIGRMRNSPSLRIRRRCAIEAACSNKSAL